MASANQTKHDGAATRVVLAKRRSWKRRLSRAVVVYVFMPYLFIAGLLTIFQRSLIYQGGRAANIPFESAGGQVHKLRVPTGDGLSLNGWLFLADGCTASSDEECNRELDSGRLLVLYFPGNAGNRAYRVADCHTFTSLGANVVLVDYRGYADNPGSPSETNLAGDSQSVWKYMTEQRGVASDKIIVVGESLGGGVATRLASELCTTGHAPAGLIVRSTFSSLVDAAGGHYPYLPIRYLLIDRYPSVDRAGAVTCPLLQLHGAADTIVPIDLGRRLFAAFPPSSASGIEKEFVELPGIGHNDVPQSALHSAAKAFFARVGGGQMKGEQGLR